MSEPYFTSGRVTLHHGDALEVAKTLESGSVQTIVTSPPYYGLRDYGEDGQIGAEPSVGEYVARMVALFRELRRVLTDDGTLWLNIGDSYSSAQSGTGGYSSKSTLSGYTSENTKHRKENGKKGRPLERAAPAKNLIGVPWRVAFALQEDGWILRSDIIWAKPNPMPESVTDRPTKAHEYLFLFAKSPRYYYDSEAIAEPIVKGDAGSRFDTGETGTHQLDRSQPTESRQGYAKAGGHRDNPGGGYGTKRGPRFGGTKYGDDDSLESRTKSGNVYEPNGQRNKRTVWTVPTAPFPGAHFAVYPPELIRPCIRAGSAPGDTVLDPFSGSGTTGMVATFEGRNYVGIDLNRDYLDLSLRTRFQNPTLAWEAS